MLLIPDGSWQIIKTPTRGNGVQMLKPITKGTVIGDYVGTVIDFAEFDLQEDVKGLYAMYYNDRLGIYPDLSKPDLHLINHSCEPNCEMYIHYGHTLFFATRDIKAQEELTISYNLSPRDELCAVCLHDCLCGRPHCTGTMHLTQKQYDSWQKVQAKQRRKTKPAPARVGTQLAPLTSYPNVIDSR